MSIIKTILNKVIKTLGKLLNCEKHEVKLAELVPQLKGVDTTSVLAMIKPGDIVLAAMPLTLEELAEIEESHRYRPYVVALKSEQGIIGYGGTSNLDRHYTHSYLLGKDNYKLIKNGQINLEHSWFIPKDNLIRIIDTVNNSDLMAINEILYLNNKENYHPLIDKQVNVYEGFVVRKGRKLYYVYSVHNSTAKLFGMRTKATSIKTIFRDRLQYIDINNEVEADLSDGFIPLGRTGISASKDIKKALKARKHKNGSNNRLFEQNHRFVYPVGQIFTAGFSSVIYLFSIKGKDYGVEADGLNNEVPQIRSLDVEHYRKDGLLERKELLDIVERMSEYDSKLTWLYEVLYKEGK